VLTLGPSNWSSEFVNDASRYLNDTQRVFESLAEVQRPWPVSIFRRSASVGAPNGTLAQSVAHMGAFPWILRDAFPQVADERIDALSRAFTLLCHIVLVCDDWMDKSRRFEATADPIRIQVMALAAYETFFELFPPGAEFWARFQAYMHEFVSACVEEQRAVAEGYPWASASGESVATMVRGRNALAKVAAAGLAALSGDETRFDPVCRSIDRFMFAFQMVDDAQDWREDVDKGAPSLLLLRYSRRYPGALDKAALAPRLFGDGLVQDTLSEAIAHYQSAADVLGDTDCPKWRELLDAKKLEAQRAITDVEDAIARMRTSIASRSHKIVYSLEAGPTARAALDYLVRQWQIGYPEGQHLLIAKRSASAPAEETLRGDVAVRALCVEAYADAIESGATELRPIVDSETEYLLSRRSPEGSGWKYFPELDELPPDFDSLGLVVTAMNRGGASQAFSSLAGDALDRIATHLLSDGAIETWIVDGRSDDEKELRRADYASRYLPCGPDAAVVGTILYGLSLHAPERFAPIIERGAEFLIGEQQNGAWASERYASPFYPSFVCARFLASARRAEPVARCRDRLLAEQRKDGGWGVPGGPSDVLSTSLAVLAMSLSPSAAGAAAACRARKFLERSDTKTWGDSDFAVAGTRCARSPVPQAESFGSRTVTAAFVLRALLCAANITQSLSSSGAS
jgi:hypothetical protein